MRWVVLLVGASLGASEYPRPNVREAQRVVVNGVVETWELVWTKGPKRSRCFAPSMAITSPCHGFGFSEEGDLDLVRIRGGAEVDRLRLGPIFGGDVTIPRWPVADSDTDDTPESVITRRPAVEIMHFGDYDHDGAQTEFYLQTDSVPFGKSYGIVIGVSKQNPRLHAFGTASHPDQPLHLLKSDREDLRKAPGPVEAIDWLCGDHGSETETTLLLRWSADGIAGTRRECGEPACVHCEIQGLRKGLAHRNETAGLPERLGVLI